MATDSALFSRERLREIGIRLLVDIMAIVVWITTVTVVFRLAELSITAYYVTIFLGVVVYSVVFDPWSVRP
ncbi:hypothetical protein [Natronolimnobius baerhuensis]|uniref:DUF8119 domain-containing protein n=1 Tax=Natronolimnobius baerhuensis TaxID=253108 RepID=A0A202E639_9EURY|nr:hypothetical protein [Natronolimnobius baerhuensis]OVE83743.1 hypothetical protein B2G88_15080 [Natronolimnobius baerhuensis]